MVETIHVEKKPLFAQEGGKKKSLFQNKRKIFVIVGLILFIVLVVGLMFYFLSKEYSTQVLEKSSLLIPFLRRKD